MIASLKGKVEAFGENWAVINVNGVGFQVFLTSTTLSRIAKLGMEAHLFTNLVVREDALTLYGFSSQEELNLFQTLMTVSGIGPKSAMSMLSGMSAEQLSTAIATGNTALLTSIPGIGKKTASRLVLELKDKIGEKWISAPATRLALENNEVVAALTALGYSAAEAARAVASLPEDKELSLEEKVKLALQSFGGK